MSPDLKQKYESKVDKFLVATFEVGDDPRDIGDKALNRGTVTGKSGPLVSGIVQMVPNPTMKTVYMTSLEVTSKVVQQTSVYSTSVS